MKLLDKLKNAFFEEVEEDEDTDTIEIPKTYAKKVEVPKKKVNFLKKNEDIDNNFLEDDEEDKKEKEEVKEKVVEKKVNLYSNETEEIPVVVEKEEIEKENFKTVPMVFDDADFEADIKEDFSKSFIEEDEPKDNEYKMQNDEYNDREKLYHRSENNDNEYTHDYISSMRDSNNNYSYSRTTVSKTVENRTFKPSPIISPIYGILDKNYRKEEVITKRETRIASTYKKPDVDSVRNRAFAKIDEDKEVTKPISEMEKKKENINNKKIYDVNNSKPQVNKVTLADADEYYNDLGLAYNVDYRDASRGNTRSAKYNIKEKKNEKKDVDDSLFDLIDSMYSKEE